MGFSVAPLSDGKVAVGGVDFSGPLVSPAFARLGADGVPDATFGDGGYAPIALGGVDGRVFSIAEHEGRLVGIGNGGPGFGLNALAMGVSPAGALDTSFHAPDGYHLYATNPDPSVSFAYMNVVHVRPDGSFYSCGAAFNPEGEANYDMFVQRYAPDGQLDPSFGEGGVVWLDVRGTSDGFPTSFNSCYGIAESPDGTIVLTGDTASGEFIDQANFVVARLLPDGSLDPSFGDGGVFQLDYGPLDRPNGLAMLPDGRVAISGFSGNYEQNELVVLVVRTD
ncbi:MAG TPA: hypothetical protein VFS00_08320, partial [Polyangiaceae bacterium]|nr:hypothetical protein [Polyangiaceae bacterium]